VERTVELKRLVVRSLGVLGLVVGMVVISGCPSLDVQTFDALNESWRLLKPYTEAGISADETLDDDSREIRIRQVEQFSRLLEAGLANAE
jgi:hypothetical protein